MSSTLEEQIDKIVNGYYSPVSTWVGARTWTTTQDYRRANSRTDKTKLNKALLLIEEADLTECLTSPSKYIREYRKLYENEVRLKELDLLTKGR